MSKKKKKGHYQKGVHNSPKCKNPINYRSGWERDVCFYLDGDESVLSYDYECVAIPYVSRTKPVKWRNYYPDFLISYADGTIKLLEVKREDKKLTKRVIQKTAAAKVWCSANNVIFEMWTNDKIKSIRQELNNNGNNDNNNKK